jgi:very-short-patch-repair endonuclease
VSPGELRNAVRQAEIRGLPIGDFTVIPDRTTSDLELDFLRLCRRARIPEPEVSAWIGRDRVDFLWRTERLIVETDSYRYHRGRVAFEGDRAKDNRLMARGFDVLRFTYWRVLNDAEDVARTVKARLALAISRCVSSCSRIARATRQSRPRTLCGGLLVDHRDHAAAAAGGELDRTGAGGEDRVVAAEAGAVARAEAGATLADDDLAAADLLAREDLDPEHLRIRVATVAARAESLLVSHLL